MTKAVVCDTATGRVLRTVDVADVDLPLQAKAGEFLWMGEAGFDDRVDPVTLQRSVDHFKPPKVLETERAVALKLIDNKAGRVRMRYVTSAPGQDATYLAKAEQAAAYKAAGYPTPCDPALYPFIRLEADALGVSPSQLADAVLAERDAWLLKGAQIEAARRAGKVAVNAAGTVELVEAAMELALDAIDAL